MKAQLVLQVPITEAPGKGLVIAACDDPRVIRAFASKMLAATEEAIDQADDPFEREYARIRAEQLRARLHFVIDYGVEGGLY